jgi:hypothetical protein
MLNSEKLEAETELYGAPVHSGAFVLGAFVLFVSSKHDMSHILSSNPITSDRKIQPCSDAQFGRQRFLNASEQTSVCTQVLCYFTYLQPDADSPPLATVLS